MNDPLILGYYALLSRGTLKIDRPKWVKSRRSLTDSFDDATQYTDYESANKAGFAAARPGDTWYVMAIMGSK